MLGLLSILLRYETLTLITRMRLVEVSSALSNVLASSSYAEAALTIALSMYWRFLIPNSYLLFLLGTPNSYLLFPLEVALTIALRIALRMALRMALRKVLVEVDCPDAKNATRGLRRRDVASHRRKAIATAKPGS